MILSTLLSIAPAVQIGSDDSLFHADAVISYPGNPPLVFNTLGPVGSLDFTVEQKPIQIVITPDVSKYDEVVLLIGASHDVFYDVCLEYEAVDQCDDIAGYWVPGGLATAGAAQDLFNGSASLGKFTVSCHQGGSDDYVVDVDSHKLFDFNDVNVTTKSSGNVSAGEDPLDFGRRGFEDDGTHGDSIYTLSRAAATANNACEFEVTRHDAIKVHIRFRVDHDSGPVIPNSKITGTIHGMELMVQYTGFDPLVQSMTEALTNTEVTTTMVLSVVTSLNSDTTSSTATAVKNVEFQTECVGAVTKLGGGDFYTRQLAAFQLTVDNCRIKGSSANENANDIVVEWGSIAGDDILPTACGTLLQTPLPPQAAQSLLDTACSAARFALGPVGDQVVDSTVNTVEFDTEDNAVTLVNHCVQTLLDDAQDGTCDAANEDTTSNFVDGTVSIAPAYYKVEDDGFVLKFYLIDQSVRENGAQFDFRMALPLDARFNSSNT